MPKYIDPQREAYERSRLDYIAVQEIAINAAEEGREQGRLEGRLEGLQEGLQKGIEQKEIEAVIGFYENEIPVALIAKSLKLSEERVQAIIAQHKK
jgi:predicted transposase YdaD